MALGGSLEENIITCLVYSDILAPHIALAIKSTDFSIAVYRRIAAAALDYLERFHQPARAHISDLLEQDLKRGPDGRFMSEVLVQIERLAPQINEEYVRDSLDRFVETQRLINAVNSASDLLHNGSLEEAREILYTPELLVRKDTPGVWLRDTSRWLGFLDNDEQETDLFSSGIEVLDEHGVRPRRGELYAFLAASGMGKSWFLINVGKHNLIVERKRVLHISLENSLDVTLQRYTQCFLALTQREETQLDIGIFEDRNDPDRVRRLRSGPQVFQSIKSLTRTELAYRLERIQGRGELLVKHFPTGILTIGMLNAFLDGLEQTEDFKPDLILLDYMTMMHLDTREMRLSIGQLARSLRGLATVRNCAIVTALQANRESAGRRQVWGSMVSEDWSTHGTCDTFLTYSQTVKERDKGFARILVDKSRNSTDKFWCFVEQAYPIGQFCTDSSYMHKQLFDQLSEDTETE